MINFLSKLFIKNRKDYDAPQVRADYGTLCSVFAIMLNIILCAIKFVAGNMAGSTSITADAINNLTDAGSAVILFVGFQLSTMKPSPDRPFGHGRLEYIVGMIVSAIILIAGFDILKSSAANIFNPAKIEFSWTVVVILIVSIGVKFVMAHEMIKTSKKINSTAIKATGIDALTDTIATAVALICLVVFDYTALNLDAYAGIVVSILVLKAGLDSGKETLFQLLGQKPDEKLVSQISDIVMSYPEVVGIHELVIHDYGPGRLMISLHAEVDGGGNIYELHDAMDRAMNELDDKLGCESVIHMDPIDTKDNLTVSIREELNEIGAEISKQLHVHDLRVVPGPTHTNLIFDVLVPFKFEMTDEQITNMFCEKVSKRHEDYLCVIKIDKAYV